jgi:hypothetical protein
MSSVTTSAAPVAVPFTPSATLWLRLAVLYLIAGVGLGIAMGSTQNFTLRPVHAHLNLLGWATMALAGLIYSVYPKAAESRLARIHFWLHNTALPVMMGSLCLLLYGHTEAVPVLAVCEFVAAAGVIVFACNVFRNVTADRAPARASAKP